MQEKRHDRVVEMRLCFFLGKVGDYNVSFVETRMCRSTADSLGYMEIDKLKDMVGELAYCDACFTGNYPMKVPTEDISHAFD